MCINVFLGALKELHMRAILLPTSVPGGSSTTSPSFPLTGPQRRVPPRWRSRGAGGADSRFCPPASPTPPRRVPPLPPLPAPPAPQPALPARAPHSPLEGPPAAAAPSAAPQGTANGDRDLFSNRLRSCAPLVPPQRIREWGCLGLGVM